MLLIDRAGVVRCVLSLTWLALVSPGVASGSLRAQESSAARIPLNGVLPSDPVVRTGLLENGLRYYLRANPKPEKRAELRLVVNAGSVLEDADQQGLAHFVEHMAFNGTRNFSKSAIVDFLELSGMRFGADVNASTGFDETVYMLQLPTDSLNILARGLQILEEWASGIAFDSAEVEKERGVVLEEWRLGRGAASRIRDKQLPVLLSGSLYAERVPIGDELSLRNFSHDALRRFYRDWYRPDLMAIIVVGDIDVAAMERQIRERFGRLARSASPRARPAVPVPDHAQPLISVATDPEETATTVSVFFKRDARRDSTVAGYRRQIAEQLFDQITNERYYEISVKPDAPFAYAYAGQSGLVRTEEAYSVGVGVKDGGAEAGLRAALMEVERLARFGFTETELARARANSLRSMEQAFAERDKTNSGVFASEYVRAFLSGESFPGIAYEYDLYKRFVPEVEVAELNAMAREVLAPGNRVILASGPEKVGAELPTSERFLALFGEASGAQLSAYADSVSDAALIPVPPVPGSVTSVQRIEELGVTEWILSNGVRMVLKPTDFKQDEIRMSGFSPGGTSLASNSDAFVMENASIAIEVGGIGAFDQVALSKRLAGKAAGASPYISSLEEGIGGSASPKDVETMFELVHLYFTSPRKDSSAFEAFKQSARAMLENASADPDGVYSDTLTRVLTNYHPRVRLISAGMLDSLDLDRSLTFYKERFADASDFTFVVVGNFSVDSLRPLVEKYIASLPALNRRETWRDNGVRPPSELVKKVVRRGLEPKGQTSLIFTGPVEFTRANRFALGALSEVLSIRLREVLREALGGTYDVSAYGSASRDPWQSYSFSISFGSAPERVDTLVRAVFAEIDSLKANGPKAQDIDKVRETMRRAYETNLTQNGYWMGQLVAYYRLGENPRQILSYPEVIATLSAELVRAAASRFLDASRYIQLSLLPER